MKEKPRELTKLTQYIVPRGTSCELPVHKYAALPIDGSLRQKKQSVIHALPRVGSNCDRPDMDQKQVPVYSGWKHVCTRWGNEVKRTNSQHIQSPNQNLW